MAYSAVAAAARRCTGTTQAGHPCRAWACWDDPGQRCVRHAGRGPRGPRASRWPQPSRPASVLPCRCAAYHWPHRPGAGLCCWPEPPEHARATPAGTRGGYRMRRRVRNGRVTFERR